MAKSVELIDFFAPWCGPCKMMEPIFEEIEKDYAGKVKISKYNIDEDQEMSSKYNVMSIPTYLILQDGKVVNQLVGAQPKEKLEDAIKDALK